MTPSTLSASDLSTERVEGWLSWLATERGNSPQTRDVRLSALRTFASYVSRHDATLASVEAQVASVPFRKAPKTKVGGMSEAAVSAILKAPGQSSRAGRRDTALMVTPYSTACRVGELLPMRKSDVFLDGTHPHAVVRGKGGKVRVAYLTEATVRHLRSHIDEFCRFEGDGHLFWSRNHPPGERPLSRRRVKTDSKARVDGEGGVPGGARQGHCPHVSSFCGGFPYVAGLGKPAGCGFGDRNSRNITPAASRS